MIPGSVLDTSHQHRYVPYFEIILPENPRASEADLARVFCMLCSVTTRLIDDQQETTSVNVFFIGISSLIVLAVNKSISTE